MVGRQISISFVEQRNQRLEAFLILLSAIIGIILLYIFNPGTSSIYPPCPFHALTGLYCPGCGSLRALHQILHGELSSAFGLNPLMVLSLPFLAYGFVSYFVDRIWGISFPVAFIPATCIWSYLGVILLFWAVRNIPAYPFSLLAP